LSDPAKLQGSAARAATDCREWVEPEAFDAEALDDTDLVVDALLGTGLDRPVAGRYAEAIEAVNAASAAVVAVDIPSGISGDTGAVMGTAIRAHLTVTFIGLKRGLLTGAAPAHTGRLIFDDLAVPPAVYDAVTPSAHRVTATDARDALAPRPRDAHKGAYGHVLVVGGDRGMGGAARLAGEAAARVGAGLTSVGTRQEHLAAVLAGRPECMVVPVEANADLEEPLQRATVAALGPGLGQGDWGRARFEHLRGWSGPMVMDADGSPRTARDHAASGGGRAPARLGYSDRAGRSLRRRGGAAGALRRRRGSQGRWHAHNRRHPYLAQRYRQPGHG
jgi:NAD(P)H-hydrate epimerase